MKSHRSLYRMVFTLLSKANGAAVVQAATAKRPIPAFICANFRTSVKVKDLDCSASV